MRTILKFILFASILCFSFTSDTASLLGTRWQMEYTAPGGESRSFEIGFNANGCFYNGHPNEQTPDNDKWSQDGRKVTITINDSYTVYKGKLNGNDRMRGTATNQKKQKWHWKAHRIANTR